MNVEKLKFDISVIYDCDEGEGCNSYLENGTYDEAVALFNDLDGRTWIDRYYHYMSIELSVHDENGNGLDLAKILDGEYSWIADYSTSNKTEASEMPAACLEFLEDLKLSKDELKAKDIEALRAKIANLEAELAEAEEELERLQGAKA